MNDTTTLILAGMAVVLILGVIYLQNQTAPQQAAPDISAAQLATLVATVAAYW